MKRNLGAIDKLVRIVVGTLLVVIFMLEIVEGGLAIVALALALIFIVTGIFNFCPLYKIFGISSCPPKK